MQRALHRADLFSVSPDDKLSRLPRHRLPLATRAAGDGLRQNVVFSARWPLPSDSYLLRYPEGSEIPPHTDPVTAGRHYRLNIRLKSPKSCGEFVCVNPTFAANQIKLFRPDACGHSLTRVIGRSRYAFSIG